MPRIPSVTEAPEALMKIDYDRIASEYCQHRKVHPCVLAELTKLRTLGRNSKVLEVGCGTGNYAIAFRTIVGCKLWAIDPSDGMLSRAKRRGGDITFMIGRAEKLDFPCGFFDLVFSVDVIHHLSSQIDFFTEAYRVLNAGGRICTVTDSEWIIRHREPLVVYFPETVEIELKRYPRIEELTRTMTQVGFGEVKEIMVEFPYELHDTQAYRDKAFSSLHLISKAAFERGIERMERDLHKGPIRCVSRYSLLWGTRPS
jgi:ubiquinone/menaquinone biosynthesis C-methylase UbiE